MRFTGNGPQPGDWMYKPESLEQLLAHWERVDRVWVPKRAGGATGRCIRTVIRATSVGGLPLHAVLVGRTNNKAPWQWFGVHLGEPPAARYPFRVLIVRKLPDEPGDLYWHPNQQLPEA